MSRRAARRSAVDTPAAVAPSPPVDGRLAGYRLIRRIASGERADVYLATADRSDEPAPGEPAALIAIRVYPAHASSTAIAVEVEAMSADASGALPALYDVATLDDGRCCLAVERMPGTSLARILTDRSLSPGEAVTVLAPIVVAVAELARGGFVHTRLSASDVLIDDAGRPRLVGLGALERLPGHGGAAERTALLRAGHVALAELVEDVAAGTRPSGALSAAVDLLRGRLDARPFLTCEPELERVLFGVASPEPISGVATRPRPVGLPARIGTPLAPAPEEPAQATEEAVMPRRRGSGGLRTLFSLAQLPELTAPQLAQAADVDRAASMLSRLRRLLAGRQRTLVFGSLMSAGALVLMLTLVPPATADGARSADPTPDAPPTESNPPAAGGAGVSSTEVPRPATATPSAPPEDSAVLADDVIAATAELLELRSSCFATLDLSCLDEVVQSGSAIESNDRAALAAAREGNGAPSVDYDLDRITLTAEMGSAVLVSVPFTSAEREPASILVMRSEAGWRLREIFD
ncbi:protein kinase [Agromyces sp. ISL-38]|uniref:protein kinase n=1 Tax=Agromyces sp. ISL-38 TaxID=2819107 RepID=UPI001BEC6475|nr:protein kinase [Agromyces sp. ISL-38]MBT2500841.1 protein kinase [Agromyces sp. ISL-38]MBT2518810.1 protein kinase [Streptomyces sp. ISL-90]